MTNVVKNLKGTLIAMIDRGGCDFLAKVENAQILGAVAVVIADNNFVCGFDTDTKNCVSVGGGVCEFIGPVTTAGRLVDRIIA